MSLRDVSRRNAERLAWGVLLLLNLATHFLRLGERAMSHDESMHAWYSYLLADTGVYRHDPMLHGPLLYHANALVYVLAGATDVTARLLPALCGVALVGLLFWFRRYLGRWGALMAAVLLTLSPTVLFYGRYLVADVYVALAGLVWVLCAWRYLESRRPGWLFGMAIAMALSFSAKETAFIFGAIVGVYFASRCAIRMVTGRERWSDSRSGEVALVMLTLTLPFASSLGLRLLGWDPAALEGPSAWTRAGIVTATVFALAALCAWASPLAFPAWLRIAALFWAIVVVLFTTVLTNVRGLMTGVVGSLGYWQGQHQVARGSQPWFYYLMLGGLYEFLAWGLSAAGAVAWVRRRRPRFVGFVLWWAIASWVAYSAAGERMPWLLLNITVPMCLLGGWWLSRFVESIDWERLEWDRALPVLAALPMAVLAIFPLLGLHPFAGRELGSLATTGRWLGHLLAVVALAVFVARRARGLPRPLLARLTALGSIAFVGLLSARFSVMLNFVNFDMASEILVYAHATPDIKRALREIDEVAARTGAGRDLQVAYDDDSAWPFTWYLRVYPKQRFYGNSPTADALRSPVVIVGSKNAEAAAPYLTRDYVRRDYRLIWWPIEDYNQGLQGLVAAVRDPSSRRRLWQVVFHRHYPDVDLGQWPYRHEFKLYLRRDLVAQAWPLGLTALRSTLAESAAWAKVAEVDCAPLAVYAGPYGGLALKAPGAVAVAPDGARLIADTGNDRVVVLDRAGGFTSAFGSRCDLGQGPAGGCLDPDAAGPRALGDGQFREPWGIASGPAGEIVVADTWNGRVQALDRQGRFLWAWGHLGVGVPPPVPPDSLYGPRGIAFDVKRDRWLVSDTGNKRLLALRRDGAFLFEAGGPGAAPGRFEEPVGVAVDPRDGSLSVADTWNRRIQRLDAEMRPAADWPVPAWEGQDAFNKPYLAVGETGDVYASDPQNARVLLLDREGRLRLTLSAPSWRTGPRARPTGLALDERAHQLLIADTANDRVWVMPQVRSASSTCPP